MFNHVLCTRAGHFVYFDSYINTTLYPYYFNIMYYNTNERFFDEVDAQCTKNLTYTSSKKNQCMILLVHLN